MSDWDDALAAAGMKQDLDAEVGDDVVKRGPGRPKGYKLSEEAKRRIGNANRGVTRSSWERAKIREGLRRYWRDPENGAQRRAHHAVAVAEGWMEKRRGLDYAVSRQRWLDFQAANDRAKLDAKALVEAQRTEHILERPPYVESRRSWHLDSRPSIIPPTRDEMVENMVKDAQSLGADPDVVRSFFKEVDAAKAERLERAEHSTETIGHRVLKRALVPGYAIKSGERRQLRLELDAGLFTEEEAVDVRRIVEE